jgi:hypothetical protein
MRGALVWVILLAVFGGIPLLLPRFIRLMTESQSEKEIRKTSESARRIAWINSTKSSLAALLVRVAQITRSVACKVATSLRPSVVVPRIIAQTSRLVLAFVGWINPRWIAAIVFGTLFVFGFIQYAPPRIWGSAIFAPFYLLIAIPALMGGPFMVIAEFIYWAFHAAAIALASVAIYLLFFNKSERR